jgi:predicted nucleotidyltransferase
MGTSPYIKTLFTINELAWNLYNSNSRNVPKKNMNPIEIGKLLKNLKQGNVEFILIGGFAMAFHGFPRATGDIDLWIKNTPENMLRLREALISTGFPEAKALRSTTQLVPGMSIFNLLESDFKIDLLHNLKLFKEKDFDNCYDKADEGEYNGVTIKVLNAADLLKEKTSANRDKDGQDISYLKKMLLKIKNKKKDQ